MQTWLLFHLRVGRECRVIASKRNMETMSCEVGRLEKAPGAITKSLLSWRENTCQIRIALHPLNNTERLYLIAASSSRPT